MSATPDQVSWITRRGASMLADVDRLANNGPLGPIALQALSTGLTAWSRDPMIYALVIDHRRASVRDPDAPPLDLIEQAARLVWQLECFSKPTVGLFDGATSGFVSGLASWGTHQAAGERFRWRAVLPMRQHTAGLDAGMAHRLARLPHRLGYYLALTGHDLGRADAYRAGLVTHCVPADRFDEIITGLADADTVDPLLDDRHVDPGAGDLAPFHATIATCFASGDVAAIIRRLAAVDGPHRAFADATAAAVSSVDPLQQGHVLRQLDRALHADVRATLIEAVMAARGDEAGEPRFALPTRVDMQSLRG